MSAVFETVIAGVTVYVLGQAVIKFILDPVLGFKVLLGCISHTLLKNQSIILSARADAELQKELFILAATLLEKRQSIILYTVTSFVFCLPSFSKVLEGSRYLNLIANRLGSADVELGNIQVENYESLKKISTNLGIVVSYETMSS